MKYMYDVSVHLLHLSSQLLNMQQRLLRQVQRLPRPPYFKYLALTSLQSKTPYIPDQTLLLFHYSAPPAIPDPHPVLSQLLPT